MKKLNNLKNNNVGADPVSARKEKGITLIALIITIIVMLILVTVSIQVALNTGLFDSAGKATQDYKAEQQKEQELGSGQVTIDNKTYESIDEYVKETQAEKITFYILTTTSTLEYTVKKGTTWEEFLKENQVPYVNGDDVYLEFGIMGEQLCDGLDLPEEAIGGYWISNGGGPVFENTGTGFEGPWVYPTDTIKDGVTYNCVM